MKIVIAIACAFLTIVEAVPKNSNSIDLEDAYAEEIKEFHFHVYFFQDNAESNKSAEIVFRQIQDLVQKGFFHPVPWKIFYRPMGPHVIGSYEVWCPKEYFSRTYSWFLLHRGKLSVLIHPLTKLQLLDHTDRVAFMGPSVPLDVSVLDNVLDHVPLEYPELKLGYSAPPDRH